MAIELKQIGQGLQKVQKQLQKMKKEHVRQIAGVIRPNFREAVKSARTRLRILFKGRGKRLRRAFVSEIRTRPDNLIARLGYVKPRGKGGPRRFHFLGRFYEQGASIRVRSKGGGNLWVPVGENRSASGAPIVTAKDFFTNLAGRSVVKMSSRGNRIAFRRDGSELVPMFVLKTSVALKPRPVVGDTIRRFLPKIEKDAGQKLVNNFRQ